LPFILELFLEYFLYHGTWKYMLSSALYKRLKYSLGRNAFGSEVGMCMYASGVKKPAGTAEEIEKHFGCEASQLIMVDKKIVVFTF